MKKINVLTIEYSDINIKPSEAPLLRGFFGNKFKNINEMHNHIDSKNVIYRYPLIQYKVINNTPMIVGVGIGSDILNKNQVFLQDEIIIRDKVVVSDQQKINFKTYNFGESKDIIKYKFETPWMCLNQSNIHKYNKLDDIDKEEFLKNILIANILSLSKGLGYNVEDKIKTKINVRELPIHFKGNKMLGFIGEFSTNFELPDYIALGKSISIGFGTIKKI